MVPRHHRYAALAVTGLAVLAGITVLVLHRVGGTRDLDSAGLPKGPVSYQFVNSRPEAHLYYPGARVLRVIGSSEVRSAIEGGSSAFAGDVMTTAADPNQIYQWYASHLKSRGWYSFEVLRASTEISVQGYRRGTRESFDVAIDNPGLLQDVIGKAVPTDGKTVFEFTYLIYPPQ